MNLNNGRIWPYAISASIIFIFGACIATIMVSVKLPVEKSDTYMMGYQEANVEANNLIKSRIEFDKQYQIKYITDNFNLKDSVIKYSVSDIDNNPVNSAKLKIIITRPNNHKNDQEIIDPKIENGIYSFSNIDVPLEGRWDIMAKISIDDKERFYNIKADTRKKEFKEY
ncbi:MAG: FixH family protein [Campylobacterota bacterium]|nr:FixH family protein [Campylobacterota bacterium]